MSNNQGFSAADDSRLRSWILDIIPILRPDWGPGRLSGTDMRFGASDGLSISTQTGFWRYWPANDGGPSAIKLLKLISNRSEDETEEWARAYLANKQGEGRCTAVPGEAGVDESDATFYAMAKEAQRSLDEAVSIVGTPGATNLESRSIPLPRGHADILWQENARPGEGAIICVLRSRERIVGVQRIYLDPYGRKSLARPVKQIFKLERGTPDAVFEIGPAPNVVGIKPDPNQRDAIYVEGAENAITLTLLNPGCRVAGMPGWMVFKAIPRASGQRILLFRDGKDAPADQAYKGTTAAIDDLLLGGVTVLVTRTPRGYDANAIVQRKGRERGAKILRWLITRAKPAELSREGKVKELAQLDRIKYAEKRKAAAADLGMGLRDLDKEVNNRRKREEKKTVVDVLLGIAAEAELFHSGDGTAYADVMINGHRETLAVRRNGFSRWLRRQYLEVTGTAPNAEAIGATINTVDAKAAYDGLERRVFVRVGEDDGKVYIDLADDAWRAIEVDARSWRVTAAPPVRFRRAPGMLPLPIPAAGGKIADLKSLINVPDDDDFILVVAWIITAMREGIPYPILVLNGEHGAAKSSAAWVIRSLVDPNSAPLRSLPRSDHDLFIAASNAWVLNFDNLSDLAAWLSDCLCRLATGFGYASRELYSDADEVIFDAMRPILVNGITSFVERQDLSDRSLFVTLGVISAEGRKAERAIIAAFRKAHPALLGALLDIVSSGLRRVDNITLARLPRMADFALWASACESALGYGPGKFLDAYFANIENAVGDIVSGDLVAGTLRRLLETETEKTWTGTASDLLDALSLLITDAQKRSREWPKAANALTNRLRQATTFLRRTGMTVEFLREGKARTVCATLLPPEVGGRSPSSSPSSFDNDASGLGGDGLEKRSSSRPSSSSQGPSSDGEVPLADDDRDDPSDDPDLGPSPDNVLNANNNDDGDGRDDLSRTSQGRGAAQTSDGEDAAGLSAAPVTPNGVADAPQAPPVVGVADLVREARAAHPDWTPKKIAADIGQPEARVRRILEKLGDGAAL
jgi:hypothetical protein